MNTKKHNKLYISNCDNSCSNWLIRFITQILTLFQESLFTNIDTCLFDILERNDVVYDVSHLTPGVKVAQRNGIVRNSDLAGTKYYVMSTSSEV